jgi:hypothetical protein
VRKIRPAQPDVLPPSDDDKPKADAAGAGNK